MKNIFVLLLLLVTLSESCVNKEEKISEDIKTYTVQRNIQIIDKGGIILPDKRDEL